jgi:hypothetical protein
MTVAATGLITRHTPQRERIYRALLAQPTREWTARGLWEDLPAEAAISGDFVRSTLYVLLGRKAARQVFGQRVMTFRLTPDGETALRTILRDWQLSRLVGSPLDTAKRTAAPRIPSPRSEPDGAEVRCG